MMAEAAKAKSAKASQQRPKSAAVATTTREWSDSAADDGSSTRDGKGRAPLRAVVSQPSQPNPERAISTHSPPHRTRFVSFCSDAYTAGVRCAAGERCERPLGQGPAAAARGRAHTGSRHRRPCDRHQQRQRRHSVTNLGAR